MAPHVVDEGEVDVPLPDRRGRDVGQDQVLVHQIVTAGLHAGQGGGDPGLDLSFAVVTPALTTETVSWICKLNTKDWCITSTTVRPFI